MLERLGPTMPCCHFWEGAFRRSGGQNYQRDDSLGSCASIRHAIALFPTRYDMRWLIEGKFRGFAPKIGVFFLSIAISRGGRRQISRGAGSKL